MMAETSSISRDYISWACVARAGDLVTRELGRDQSLETRQRLERGMTAERWTRLDRCWPGSGAAMGSLIFGRIGLPRAIRCGRSGSGDAQPERLGLAEPAGSALGSSQLTGGTLA